VLAAFLPCSGEGALLIFGVVDFAITYFYDIVNIAEKTCSAELKVRDSILLSSINRAVPEGGCCSGYARDPGHPLRVPPCEFNIVQLGIDSHRCSLGLGLPMLTWLPARAAVDLSHQCGEVTVVFLLHAQVRPITVNSRLSSLSARK
jgi:hypothetical protein